MFGKIKFVIKNMFYNIKYMLTHNLYMGDDRQKLQLLEIINWHLGEKQKSGLKILNQEETIELLKNEPRSFCRFGDGEVDIIEGKSIPFQKYDPRLADYFRRILSEKHDNLYVGLNYYYYHDFEMFNEYTSDYYKLYSHKYGSYYKELCNPENIYIDAGFNQIYQSYKQYNFDEYYDKIKALFEDKEVILFVGEGVLDKHQYDIFERAREVVYEKGPSKDSFSEFDELLDRAMKYSKDDLLCFILGPTSKALAYELSLRGYCAWDIGHLAKDYNSFMLKEERSTANLQKFYAPD